MRLGGVHAFRLLLPGVRLSASVPIHEGPMRYAMQLLDTYPVTFNVNGAVLAATTDTVNDCAQAYTSCAGDSLAEQEISDLVEVIRLDLEVCTATVRLISRQTKIGRQPDPVIPDGVRDILQELRRRVRAARHDAPALPRVRWGMSPLRGSVRAPCL